ncbi:murein DD-endopeptidase MepM/ murein hydrolase activator NlpD [Rhizobium herbae]|uniref:Murein DD-endopeptidase MepM/ murein hydrolase activator NlpD n=1 Tax=Rhizobium herbae TaxID=508661 RepID=A0ABS4EG83_9HYPH|nr:murein DD-endopeptidase MepM/ murein hydrolase activator NlpD [Rhizobium herbae]
MSTESRVFGKRAQKHIIILASGDRVRHMTFQPWMAALSICFISVFSIGYLAATSYLVLRDDLIGGTMARQARMQHEYEDRIAALRAQVDRVTSRQLLDQQVVEDKVEKLLQQQMALSSRHGKLGTLLDRAEESGIAEKEPQPTLTAPQAYEKRADASGGIKAIERLMGMGSQEPQQKIALAYAPQSDVGGQEPMSDRADRLFSKVTLSLKDIEQEQKSRIESLTAGASQATDAIMTILARTGVKVPQDEQMPAAPTIVTGDESAIGGPFVEPETTEAFDRSLVGLDTALARLEHVRSQVKKLPFNNPSPASDITSTFGNRLDPFLGRLALHAGIDFRAPTGTRILATAPGTVIAAGKTGGYGNLVEIDHGNGITTRYAHLSTILVNVGNKVSTGEAIARSGSTGRSTGPHLHYEVRLNGEAVDPMRFLTAGIKLSHYIN